MTNNVVTDDILYQYISYAGSDQLIGALTGAQYWQGEHNQALYTDEQFDYLKTKYTKEMQAFIDKIKKHPSVQQIGVKDSQVSSSFRVDHQKDQGKEWEHTDGKKMSFVVDAEDITNNNYKQS